MLFTVPLNQIHISKEVSIVPSVFRRTILFVVTQLYVVKSHPTNIFPLFCIARVITVLPLNPHPIVKEESLVPSAFRRTILFVVTQLYDVKKPPRIIFPSL
jgi:hypothetical protein